MGLAMFCLLILFPHEIISVFSVPSSRGLDMYLVFIDIIIFIRKDESAQ